MGRYFIAIRGGDDPLVDEEGGEFSDERLALAQAALTAGETLRTAVAAPGTAGEAIDEIVVRIDVSDENRRPVGAIEAKLSLPTQT